MTDYPIRVLSFGAGVQSTTLLRMALTEEIEPVKHVIFADTGWEPAAVYEHMKYMRTLTESHGVEFHIVSGGNIREDALNPDHGFASMPVHAVNLQGEPLIGRRQCTREYKLAPINAKQREIAGLKTSQRCSEHRITTLIGISLDEIQRMKDPAFSWIRNEYPLVDLRMSRNDCVQYHIRRNMPQPPRSACIGCPYRTNQEWRDIRKNPSEWADAVEFDEALRSSDSVSNRMFEAGAYLHSSRVPLKDVDLSTEEDRGQISLFGGECEGMCGV